MFWEHVKTGFLDELTKISEVSLSGLTPGALLSAPSPKPMMTEGYQKAQHILELADQIKTSSVMMNPGIGRLTNKNSDDPSAVQQAKGLGAYALGGAGAGRMIGEFAVGRHLPVGPVAQQAAHSMRWHGTAVGAAIGAGEFARRRIMQRRNAQKAKTAGFSPGMALKAGQQTGKVRGFAMRSKGSIASHVRGSQIH